MNQLANERKSKLRTRNGVQKTENGSHIRIIPFPAIPGEINNGTTSGVLGVGYGISASIELKSAEEKAAAIELVKWLSGKEVQTYNFESNGTPPSRNDVHVDAFFVEPLILERINDFQGRVSGTTYILDDIFVADVFIPINTGLQQIGLGEAIPESVAKETQEKFNEWFARKP